MLRSSFVLLAFVCLASAATVDNTRQQSLRYPAQPKAEERDGAHHGASGGHHGSSSGASSYSAPSHSSGHSSPSYSGGGGGGGHGHSAGNDQGNLYYYYYPVEEYGHTEAADAGFDVFTAIILPLLILGGLLLALSSFTFNFTTGRSMGENIEPSISEQLQTEVERIFYLYLNAFESESCIKRTVCESGVYAKNFKQKDFIFSLADPLVPETMKGNMALFKMAAKDGFDTGKCKKYRCHAPKIFQ